MARHGARARGGGGVSEKGERGAGVGTRGWSASESRRGYVLIHRACHGRRVARRQLTAAVAALPLLPLLRPPPSTAARRSAWRTPTRPPAHQPARPPPPPARLTRMGHHGRRYKEDCTVDGCVCCRVCVSGIGVGMPVSVCVVLICSGTAARLSGGAGGGACAPVVATGCGRAGWLALSPARVGQMPLLVLSPPPPPPLYPALPELVFGYWVDTRWGEQRERNKNEPVFKDACCRCPSPVIRGIIFASNRPPPSLLCPTLLRPTVPPDPPRPPSPSRYSAFPPSGSAASATPSRRRAASMAALTAAVAARASPTVAPRTV